MNTLLANLSFPLMFLCALSASAMTISPEGQYEVRTGMLGKKLLSLDSFYNYYPAPAGLNPELLDCAQTLTTQGRSRLYKIGIFDELKNSDINLCDVVGTHKTSLSFFYRIAVNGLVEAKLTPQEFRRIFPFHNADTFSEYPEVIKNYYALILAPQAENQDGDHARAPENEEDGLGSFENISDGDSDLDARSEFFENRHERTAAIYNNSDVGSVEELAQRLGVCANSAATYLSTAGSLGLVQGFEDGRYFNKTQRLLVQELIEKRKPAEEIIRVARLKSENHLRGVRGVLYQQGRLEPKHVDYLKAKGTKAERNGVTKNSVLLFMNERAQRNREPAPSVKALCQEFNASAYKIHRKITGGTFSEHVYKLISEAQQNPYAAGFLSKAAHEVFQKSRKRGIKKGRANLEQARSF